MSEKKHSKRKVMLIVFAVIVGTIIILSFTVIGTGAVENGMAAVKPHPAPPPPTISFPPPPSDQSSGDGVPRIDGTEGDVEDDDTPAPPDQVAAAPSGVPAVAPTAPTTTEQTPATPSVTTTTQTATTTNPVATPTVTTPQVVMTPTVTTSRAVTTQAPTPPPPPLCLNHPDFSSVPGGWNRSKDGNCNEIPKLDLALSGPARVNAPGGAASLTITIVNNGSNLASGVLFKQQLDANGNLSLVDLKASQGDPFGKVDDRTFVCSIGTILPGQSAIVTVTLRATGAGSVTVGVVEPGGEADTNIDNNHLSVTIVPTVLQTQRTVQQHGLLWGGHYYGSVSVFARILAREGSNWHGWKKNHSALAQGLLAHDALVRRK